MQQGRFTIVWFIVLGCIFPSYLFAQQNALEAAKNLRKSGHYDEAIQTLKGYVQQQASDPNGWWLLAQTESWKGHVESAGSYYQKAMSIHPQSDYLVLDYARFLLDNGQSEEAIRWIDSLETQGKKYTSGQFIRAKYLFWNGRLKEARDIAEGIMMRDGNNTEAYALWKEIKTELAIQLEVSYQYKTDNQPIQIQTPAIWVHQYENPWIHWSISAERPAFTRDSALHPLYAFSIGNESHWFKHRVALYAKYGLCGFPLKENAKAIWSVKLEKSLFKHWNADLQADEKPYFSTRSSLDTNLLVKQYQLGLGYSGKWQWKSGIILQQFPDANTTRSYYSWISIPLIKATKITLHGGYSFAYNHSEQNTFSAIKNVSEIIQDSSSSKISGAYAPYFTPTHQYIHMVQAQLRWKAGKHIQLQLQGKYGVYAVTDNPYLYLNINAASETYIARGFQQIHYSPWEAGVLLNWNIHERMGIQVGYSYMSTYFYEMHQFGVQIHTYL